MWLRGSVQMLEGGGGGRRAGGRGGGGGVRVYLFPCAQLQPSLPLPPLPAPTGFTFSYSEAVKFGGCSAPHPTCGILTRPELRITQRCPSVVQCDSGHCAFDVALGRASPAVLWVRVECVPHCSRRQHSVAMASTPLPALTRFWVHSMPYCPMGMLPVHCRRRRARVISCGVITTTLISLNSG